MSQTKAQLISDLVQALNFTGTASAPANGAFLSAANTLALATNSAQRLTIDSNGRVMIGTTTLGHSNSDDLTVNNSGNCGITIRSGTSNDGNIFFADADSDTIGTLKYDHTNNAFRINTNGSERMRIDSSGRVGIGTTSPVKTLHVSGDVKLTTASGTQFPIETRNDFTPNVQRADLFFALNATSNNALRIGSIDSNGGITVQATRGNNSAVKHNLIFNPDGGNIGIGTTSPSSPFTVSDGDQGFEVHPNSSSTVRLLAFDRTNSVRKNLRIDALAYEIQCNNGTEKIRIDSSGRIGIGTTSPAVRLEVEDTISATFSADNSITAANQLLKLENLGSNSFAGMHFRTAGGGDGHFGTFQNTSSANDCTFYFSNQIDSGGGQLLATLDSQTGDFIVNKGKVGIGETSPAHKLHISAAESTTIAYFDTDLGGRGLKINTFVSGNAASAGVEFEAPAGANKSAFVFKGASEFMRLNASGNLGIGTSSPALLGGDGGRVLHLAGSANPEIVLERTTSGTEAKASMRITDTEDLRFAVKDGSASTIDALSIDSTTGNVGIGVTDVKAALQVNSSKNAETDRHDGSNYHLFLRNPADDAGEACGLAFSVTSNATKTGAAIMHEREGGGSLGSLQFYTNSDGNSVSERVRITSDGKLLVGTTSGSNFSSNVAEFVNATQDAAVGVRSGTGVNGQDFITFKFGGGPTACGGIRRDGTTQGPELFSNSDRRIKTNILDMDNVLDKINQLSLKKFDFKDGTGSGIGLIAQDLISIFPSKVKKDDSDDGTGDTVPDGVSAWTIGNNFTYEILKAIQELSAKVEALEAA